MDEAWNSARSRAAAACASLFICLTYVTKKLPVSHILLLKKKLPRVLIGLLCPQRPLPSEPLAPLAHQIGGPSIGTLQPAIPPQ
jgi:hypothetical protein